MDKPLVLLPLIVVLVVLAFVADLYVPLAAAGGLAYLFVMLVALRLPRREHTVLVAVLCSMLACLAVFMSGGELNSWQLPVNRLLALGGIWAITLLGWQSKDAYRSVENARRDLHRRAGERADELLRANEELQAEIAERRRAEDALRTSEALYHSLVDNLSVHVIRKDLDGKFTYASPSFCKLMARAPDKILGKTDFDFYPMPLARKYRADDRRVIEAGLMFEDVESNQRPDGAKTYVQVMKNPIYDARDRAAGIQCIFWDVTARMRAEAELRESDVRKRAIFDAAMDCIIFTDQDGQIVEINRAAEHTFGFRRRELVGKKMAEVFVPPEGRQRHQDNLDRYSGAGELGSGIGRRVEAPLLRRGGETFLAEMATQPIPLRGTAGFAIFLRDITDRKRAERALQETKDAAEAANRAKGLFLANMSHEIRTPLNAVVGMTDLLQHTPLTGQQHEYLTIVQESADSLLTVINDILDFSKIEAGKLSLDNVAFDLHERLGDCLRPLALRADAKRLELLYRIASRTPARVLGDPHRLRQVVVNLVGNAIKFTQQGEVELSVEPQHESGERVLLHFRVRDTGIGIPKDKQSMVFSAFEQADNSTTRQFGGTGLGLAISSRLARLMGGRTWVESREGEGSTFHFTARFQLASGGPEARIEQQRLRDASVLLVDDNASCRSLLQSMCDDWGLRASSAASVAEALEMLQRSTDDGQPFQLVVCDAAMPGDDGFQFVQRLREKGEVMPPVLMLVNSGRPGDVDRCAQFGVAGYLLKPVKPRELLVALDHVMRAEEVPREQPVGTDDWDAPKTPLHILLAEDSLVNQKLAVALLERHGHSVRVAGTGREALDAVQEDAFDIVLMDVQMPEMDGLETTRRIRQLEAGGSHRLPIVAMTAHAMKGDKQRCLDAGMDDYISKPIRAVGLYQTIARAVRGGQPAAPTDCSSNDAHHVFADGGEGESQSESRDPVCPTEAADVEVADVEADGHQGGKREEGPRDERAGQLDEKALRALVRGDESLMMTLVETFLGECPRLLRDAHAALDDGDAPTFQRAVHTLKSSLNYFGATRAAGEALALEIQAKAGQLDEAEDRLRALEGAATSLSEELRELLATRPPASNTSKR